MGISLLLVAAIPVSMVLLLLGILFRRRIVQALPFLAALNGVGLQIAGATVRFEQLAALLLVGALVVTVATGRRRFYLDRVSVLLAGSLAVNLLATLAHSPARAYSLSQLLNLASVWSIYVVLVNYVDTREELEFMVKLFLISGLAEALLGVGAFFAAAAGVPVGGANISIAQTGTAAFGAFGTMMEPNLFGNFCQMFFIAALALIILAPKEPALSDPRRQRFYAYVATGCGVGLFFSFTRGAWLGTAVGLVILLVMASRMIGVRVRASRVVIPLAGAAALAVILWFLPTAAGEYFRYKVQNIVNPGSTNANIRLVSYGLALQNIMRHPWLGSGTYSFAAMVAGGSDFRQFVGWRNLWIGNYLLLVLHDTGIIGLTIFAALLTTFTRAALKAIRLLVSTDIVSARTLLALTAAFVSLLISFLTSSGLTLGYPWVLMGLIGAWVRITNQHQTLEQPR